MRKSVMSDDLTDKRQPGSPFKMRGKHTYECVMTDIDIHNTHGRPEDLCINMKWKPCGHK